MKLHFASAGAGRPIVILHGLFGSLNNWQSMARALSSAFRVYTVDARNHGLSPHTDEFSYPAMAADLLEFLDDQALPAAVLLGHSMGGKTAMQFALLHAERTEALIVVDIAPRPYPRGHDAILDAMAGVDLSRHSSRESIEAELAPSIPDPRVRQFVLTNLKRHAGGTYSWKVNLAVLKERYEDVSGGLDDSGSFTGIYPGPALFLAGGRSDYIMEADLPGIRGRFPSARIQTIPGAGHWVHSDAPAEFLSAVTTFLAS